MILIRLTEEWFPRLSELDTSLEDAAVYALRNGLLQRQEGDIPEFSQSVPYPEQTCLELVHLHQQGGLVMGAQASGRLVALAATSGTATEKDPTLRTLHHCYIDRQWRGKGLGSALLRALSREALREGAEHLFVPSIPAADTVDFWVRRGASLLPAEQTPISLRETGAIPLKFTLVNI